MANFAVTPTDTTFTVQVGENTLAAANSATAAAASAAAAAASEAAADASAAAADASFDGIAAALAVQGIGNGPASYIKTLNPAAHPTVYRTDAGLQGWYTWDAAFPINRARAALPSEHLAISPNIAVPGAWVRTNLSRKERDAINKANRRIWEKLPEAFDNFDPSIERIPLLGKHVNFSSSSEDLSDSSYVKSSRTLEDDFAYYKGIRLQKTTLSSASFFNGIGDNRAADYDLEDGKLYIASCYAMAPRDVADVQGLRSPNAFAWMFQPSNGTSYASGAKLLFPFPRRIWSVVRGGPTARTVEALTNPRAPWGDASQRVGGQSLQWLCDANGLGPNTRSPEMWLGGCQLEFAPNQTEKMGIAVVGTSLDTNGGQNGLGTDNWVEARGWPRWLEGMLNVPVFSAAIGGQLAATIDSRFNTDIAPLREHSKYLILASNVNDFQPGFDSAAYRASWASIYAKARTAGWEEDEIIFTTIQRRSIGNFIGDPEAVDAENAYIKQTYRKVIDRDEIISDAINERLIPEDWEVDGVHLYTPPGAPAADVARLAEALRGLGMMMYLKYRHFFHFDNVPGPYQKTVNVDGRAQSFGEPLFDTLKGAVRLDAAAAVSAYRDNDLASAPYVIFDGVAGGGGTKTFQIPGPKYQRATERVNTEVLRQTFLNLSSDALNIRIQYYQANASNVITTLGGVFDIPPGTARTIFSDGVSVWSENPSLGASTGWSADTGTAKKTANATYTAGATLPFGATYSEAELDALATRLAAVELALQNDTQRLKAVTDALIAAKVIVP